MKRSSVRNMHTDVRNVHSAQRKKTKPETAARTTLTIGTTVKPAPLLLPDVLEGEPEAAEAEPLAEPELDAALD